MNNVTQNKPSAWVVLSFVNADMNHANVVGGRDICASDKRTHGQTSGEITEELRAEMVPSHQFRQLLNNPSVRLVISDSYQLGAQQDDRYWA